MQRLTRLPDPYAAQDTEVQPPPEELSYTVINNRIYVINNRKDYKPCGPHQLMASTEEHEKTIRELLDDIEEKVRLNLVAKRQKIIGFAVSEAATNIFALYLHKKNLIDPGFQINHSFFASLKKAQNTFSAEFPRKNEILELLVRIEELRNRLCYGREKEAKEANEAVESLYKLKSIAEEK